MSKKELSNADKLLNYLDEIGELHNFFAELCFGNNRPPSEHLEHHDTPSGYISGSFLWLGTIDGHDFWWNIYRNVAKKLNDKDFYRGLNDEE